MVINHLDTYQKIFELNNISSIYFSVSNLGILRVLHRIIYFLTLF